VRDRLPASPQAFEAELRDLVKEAALLAAEYRWVYSAAYGQASGEGLGVSGSSEDQVAGMVIESDQRNKARGAMVGAREKLRDARSKVREAETRLGKVVPKPRPQIEFEGRHPRSVSRAELREAREAQERRQARGEGWGDG